jgi:hypothetical protein
MPAEPPGWIADGLRGELPRAEHRQWEVTGWSPPSPGVAADRTLPPLAILATAPPFETLKKLRAHMKRHSAIADFRDPWFMVLWNPSSGGARGWNRTGRAGSFAPHSRCWS